MGNFQWVLGQDKFLGRREIDRLRKILIEREKAARRKGSKVAVRDWFVVDFILFTGLRVQEVVDLECGDINLENHACVFVRNGKGGRQRVVWFNGELGRHIKEYFVWKKSIGEEIRDDAPLICSSKTGSYISKRAVQRVFERSAERAGITGHSIHHLRHTYASYLYKASEYNLRLVQKQLGHSSIKITQVYADVFNEDIERAVGRLYN